MILADEIQRTREEMMREIENLVTYGVDLAKKEATYQAKKSQRTLELQAEGQSATTVNNIIRGDEKVVRARLERDIAQVLYDHQEHKINGLKLTLRSLESQISREWANAE